METHTPIRYGSLRGIDPKTVSTDELIEFVRDAGHQLVLGRPTDTGDTTGPLSVTDTAARMDVTPMFLRLWLRSGKCPFGTAQLMPGGRWSYYINPVRFERYMAGEDMTSTQEVINQ